MAKAAEWGRNCADAEDYRRGVEGANQECGYQPSRQERIALQERVTEIRSQPVHGISDMIRHAAKGLAEAATTGESGK